MQNIWRILATRAYNVADIASRVMEAMARVTDVYYMRLVARGRFGVTRRSPVCHGSDQG